MPGFPFNSGIDLLNVGEIQNAKFQILASAPSALEAKFYYDSTLKMFGYYNGSRWVYAGNLLIASDSTSYLEFDTTTGELSINVDTTPTKNSTNLITSGGAFGNTVNTVALKTNTTDTISVTKGDSTTDIKISKVDEATKATNDEDGNNIKSTYATKTEVADDITLTDLSIASDSTDYLSYDNLSGEFSASVDTTVSANSTNLVTSGAVQAAIDSALTGALIYQGTWTATGQTDYSSITLPVKKGYMYAVSGTATIGGVEWNSGDYLVINKNISSSGTITSADVDKIDNSEGSDIVRLNATQTLTNKTIDADDNTIVDLTTTNFKSGIVRTSIRATSSATDTNLVTEKAVATAIATKAKAFYVLNTALTASGGVCTWSFTNSIGTKNVQVQYFRESDGVRVETYTVVTASTITATFNSTSNIAANTYRAVVTGLES